MPDELVQVPDDLRLLSDAELAELEGTVIARFDAINGDDDVSPEALDEAEGLALGLDRIRAEKAAREVRAEETEKNRVAAVAQRKAELADRVHGTSGNGDINGDGDEHTAPVDVEELVAAASRGTVQALIQVLGDRVGGRELATAARQGGTLAAARQHQPDQTKPKPRLAVTASVEIPGVSKDTPINDFDALVDIVQRKAKSMPITNRSPNQALVASIRNEYEHTVDDRTKPGQVEELFKHLTSGAKTESAALLAAGGWCAPSETRYDFFNVAATSGLVDLPSFGVSRGGVNFPTSPSLADVVDGVAFGGFSEAFSITSVPWLWTEEDDIDAADGSGSKPCIRVPCPDFTEERLECYGLCVTAGNLTDDAYPEATANFLQLMVAAHEHARNGRILAQMETASGVAINTGLYADSDAPAFNQVFSGVALGATDYRARFGMDINAVLEVVIPYWVLEVIRADIAYRTGTEASQVSDGQIVSQFTNINVRPQFVNDWQVRGAGEIGAAAGVVDWPTSANVMLYAAGTFLQGNGLSLDLGVVRDSALNSTNDHTAAWSEECHLVAMVGHESRLYEINFCVSGATGAANITCAT